MNTTNNFCINSFNLNFLLILSFLLFTNVLGASTLNSTVFFDNTIEDKESLLAGCNEKGNNENTFHLFSHGRSGELLINGAWKNAKEIANFLNSEFNIQNSTVSYLNIYGCEFAKGKKGKQAVAYLEKTLGVQVNASTNITGKDGDWILEVGNVKTNQFKNYQYNLQTCPAGPLVRGIAPDEDYDGDGICNRLDLDDDNDGILDEKEQENCEAVGIDNSNIVNSKASGTTSTTLSNAEVVTSSMVVSHPNLDATSSFDGYSSGVVRTRFSGSTNLGNTTDYFEVSYTFDKAIKVQLSYPGPTGTGNHGTTDVFQLIVSSGGFDINNPNNNSINVTGNSATQVTFSPNSGGNNVELEPAKRGYTVTTSNAVTSVKLRFKNTDAISNYMSIKISAICVEDKDNDGIPNHLDLDSDGDGCPDAIEGGGSFDADDLETSTIPGGNTGGSFTGILGVSPVQTNLGTTVNTNGIPTIVTGGTTSGTETTGQSIGISQNKAIENCTDTDGDGINDYVDLDDDNDGILDADEGYCEAVKDIVFVLDQSGSINTTEATDMVNGIKTFLAGDIGSGRDISFVVMEDDNVYGEEQPALIKVAMTGTSVPASITTYLDNWLAVANSPAVGRDYWASGFQGVIQHLGADLGPNYEVIVLTDGNSSSFMSTRTAAIPILGTGAHLFAIGPYDQAAGATPTVGEFQAVMDTTYGEPTQEVTDYATDYETSEFDFVPDYSGLGTVLSTQLGVALCKVQDTDNDGIADYLDLDSDGDGCPDAIEGGGSFDADDLETSTIPGGNSGTNYNGLSNTGVQQNLGTTVDTNSSSSTYGVPIVSPATTAVTQAIGDSQTGSTDTECCKNASNYPAITDSDSDGIGDGCDLDNDNDGILDEKEQENCEAVGIDNSNIVNSTVSGTTYTILSNGEVVTSSMVVSHPNLVATSSFDGYSSGVVRTRFSGPNLGNTTDYFEVSYTFDKAIKVQLSYPGPAATGNHGTSDVFQLIVSSGGFDINNPNNNSINVTENSATQVTFSPNSGGNNVELEPAKRGYTVTTSNAVTSVKLRFKNTDMVTNYVSIKISATCIEDKDNDGIPNHLDLDSDGDGCPDAIEGGGSFVNSQLVTDTNIDGGNTGGSFTGISGVSPVQTNLGTTVNTNGIPTIVTGGTTSGTETTGQSIGISQNKAIENCTDTDGDGIIDYVDLDDDNDGILDTDEGYCEAEAVKDIVFVLDQSGSISTTEATDMVNGIKAFLAGDIGSGRDISFVVMEDDNVYGEEQPALIKVAMTGTSVPAIITTYLNNWLAVANGPAVGRDYWASGFQGVIQHLGAADLGPNYEVIVLADGSSSSFMSTRTAAIPILNTGAHIFAIGPWQTVGLLQAVMDATYGEPTQEVTDYATDYDSSEFDFVPDYSGLGIVLSTQLGVAFCKVQDTDNDGIADYLDLDSDGDGCPDAIEGAGSFDADDLETSTIPGGNSGTNYNGLSNTGVQQNLGTTVDTNSSSSTYGVPIVSPATTAVTQAIGDSQTGSTDTECCKNASNYPAITDSDSDGIGDGCDLDDDNDGILDTDEGYCEAATVKDIVFVLDQSGSISTTEATDMVNGIKTFLAGDIGSGRDISFVVMEDDNVYGEEQPALIKVAMTGTSVPASITTYLDNWLAVANGPSVGRGYWASGFQGVIQHLGADLGPNYEVIVLTDGNSSSFTSTRTAAIPILNTGAHLFAIGPYDQAFGSTPTVGEFQAVMDATYGEPTQEVTDYATDYETSEFDFVPDFSGLGTVLNTQLGVALCKVQDTDNDGIADYLDLDSDGDGCPDAIEGGDAISQDSLQSSMMAGGNTDSTGFTGTAGPVTDNLGNDVDTTVGSSSYGVPTIAGMGQDTGTAFMYSDEDTITEHPESQAYCEDEIPATVTFTSTDSASLSTDSVHYQWQESLDDGFTFTDISGASGTVLSNTQVSLDLNGLTRLDNGILYRVVYSSTSSPCEIESDPALLTVYVKPILTLTERSFCIEDNPTELQASPTGGTFSGGTYVTSGGVFDPGTAGIGSHQVIYNLKDINGCVSIPDTATILVTENPSIALTSNPICVYAAAEQLIDSPAGGTYSGAGVSSTGLFDPSIAGVGTHRISYTVTATETGCAGTAYETVIVNRAPLVQMRTAGPFCLNNSEVQLTAIPAGGTYSGTGVSSVGVFTPTTAGVGIHTITYSVTENGCKDSTSISIEVLNSSILNATPSLDTICSGDSTSINITGNNNATLSWRSDVFGRTGTDTLINEEFINNGSTDYTVNFSIESKIGKCLDKTTSQVVVKANPLVQSYSKNAVICDYEDLSVKLTAPLSGTLINWTLYDNSNNSVKTGSSLDIVNIKESGLSSGNYTLEYTGTKDNCTSQTYTLPITIN